MSFSEAEIERIARLARVALTREEARALGAQLAAITREFEGLAAYATTLADFVDESTGEPREDLVEASDPGVLAGAPRREPDGAIRAPKGAGG